MKKLLIMTICLSLFLTGCNPVGPDYVRPKLESPDKWTEAKEQTEVKGELEQTAWWKSFGDPVLNSLIEQAVKTNLDIQQAQARIIQARADLVIAGAEGLPSVNTSASITRSKSSDNAAQPTTISTPATTVYKAGFDAQWEIDVFGGVRRSREAAKAKYDAGVEDLRATVLTLLGDVAKNYVDLRSNQEQFAITLRNVKSQKQTVDVTRERYRMGLTSYLDVAQAEAQKAATESDIPTLQASVKQSIHRLGILLGKEPNVLKAELLEARPLPKYDGVIAAGLPCELLSRRPDLRKVERQLAAASADIGVATADLYPKFDLTGGLGLQSSDSSKFSKASSRYWSIVPGVSLPLFNGGKTRANIEGKRAVYDETLAKYRSVFNSTLEDVENALSAYYAEKERNLILAESIRSNKEAMELANERYKRGLTSFLDVLVAEKSLYSAQSSLSQSDANLLTHLISLYKALGGGWSVVDGETAYLQSAGRSG
jgi:outer membrane protein, multidrug efflux system